MPKNRSNKQAKQQRQAKARAARQDRLYDAIEKATMEAFPAAVAAGQFTILAADGPKTVTLEQIRQIVDADMLAVDGEPPLEDLDELVGLLEDEVRMMHIFLAADGLWRFPEEYLPKAGQP